MPFSGTESAFGCTSGRPKLLGSPFWSFLRSWGLKRPFVWAGGPIFKNRPKMAKIGIFRPNSVDKMGSTWSRDLKNMFRNDFWKKNFFDFWAGMGSRDLEKLVLVR